MTTETKINPCRCGSTDISLGEVLTEIKGQHYTQSECDNCGLVSPRYPVPGNAVDYGSKIALEGWNAFASPSVIEGALPGLPDNWPEEMPDMWWYSGGRIVKTEAELNGWKGIPVEIHPKGTRALLASRAPGVEIPAKVQAAIDWIERREFSEFYTAFETPHQSEWEGRMNEYHFHAAQVLAEHVAASPAPVAPQPDFEEWWKVIGEKWPGRKLAMETAWRASFVYHDSRRAVPEASPKGWEPPSGPDFNKAAESGKPIFAVVGNTVVVTHYEDAFGTWSGEEGDYPTEEIRLWMPIPTFASPGEAQTSKEA